MKLWTPRNVSAWPHAERLLSTTIPEARAASFPLPWCYDDDANVCIHVSTAVLLCTKWKKQPEFKDHEAKQVFNDWARATVNTLKSRYEPDGYDWRALFDLSEYTPREYQETGMAAVYRKIGRLNFGGLIGDDVGLGKTVQLIGVALRMREEGRLGVHAPLVVVTGASLKSQWFDELRRFPRKQMSVALVDGTGENRRRQLAKKVEAYVINWEMLRLPQYRQPIGPVRRRAALVGFDETNVIKSYNSATSVATREFAQGKVCVSLNATPIELSADEMVSQVALHDPQALGAPDGFVGRYCELDFWGRVKRVKKINEIKMRCAATYIRRTRSEVAVQLPSVVAEVRQVTLSKPQWKDYQRAVEYALQNKTEFGTNLAAIRYAAYASDVKQNNSKSAIIEDLIDLLNGELAREKVVVFSQYSAIVEHAAARLAEFNPLMIHGKVSGTNRADARRQFEMSRRHRVIIGTDAMSRGLNLQVAGVVVNLDLPWNPAVLRQRVGRIQRLGQKRKSVLALSYEPIGQGSEQTIAAKVLDTLGGRRALTEKFFGVHADDDIAAETPDMAGIREFLRVATFVRNKDSRRTR